MIDHRQHFDAKADTWDDESKIARAQHFVDVIVGAARPTGDERVLEFGAGTGLVSQFLAPHVGHVALADNSSGMRRVMGEKITSGVLPANATILDEDLVAGELPQERFDMIVASLVLHHISDVAAVLRTFAELLEPGGVACIIDLDEDPDGSFHDGFENYDGHHGFHREALADELVAAGFGSVRFDDAGTLAKHGGEHSVFLATAVVGDGRVDALG